MVLETGRFAAVAPKRVADMHVATAALFALRCESREGVDAITDAALAHGGTDNNKVQDMEGFMYGRSFCDHDGHDLEPFRMNPAAVR